MKHVVMSGVLLASVAALLAAPAAVAAEAAKGSTAEDSFMSQMRVVRDQHTGELRAPDPEELKGLIEAEKLENAARRLKDVPSGLVSKALGAAALPTELVVKRHPNGMESVRLTPDYLVQLNGHVDATGQVTLHHDGQAESHALPAAARTE